MKRNIFTCFALFVLLVMAPSCEETIVEQPSSPLTINAIVVNGNDFNAIVSRVKATISYGEVEFDVAETTYKDGGFTLTLPAVIPDNMLISAEDENVETIFRLISDEAAKFTVIGFQAYESGSKVSQYNFYHLSDGNNTIRVDYLYADREFSMKGRLRTNISGIYDETVSYIDYDAEFNKGWNLIYTSSNLVTTKKPDNIEFKWQYNGESALNIEAYENYLNANSNEGEAMFIRFNDNKYIMSFGHELKAINFDSLYNDYTSRNNWSSTDEYRAGTWRVDNNNILSFSGPMSLPSAIISESGKKINFQYFYTRNGYLTNTIFANY